MTRYLVASSADDPAKTFRPSAVVINLEFAWTDPSASGLPSFAR